MADAPIRILCVDDHGIVREGISALLRDEADMEVVGAVATGTEAIEQYSRSRPDIVLMDLQLPGMSGLEAIREIRRIDDHAHIIVLTMRQGDEDVYRAFRGGVAAYLLKDALADNLIRTIREIHGGMSISSAVANQMANRVREGWLSVREIQVLQLLASGNRNKEIAVQLGITEGTVQAHMKSIFSKLHVHDRTAAMAAGLQRGLIHID